LTYLARHVAHHSTGRSIYFASVNFPGAAFFVIFRFCPAIVLPFCLEVRFRVATVATQQDSQLPQVRENIQRIWNECLGGGTGFDRMAFSQPFEVAACDGGGWAKGFRQTPHG